MRLHVRPAFWQPACVDIHDYQDRERVLCLFSVRYLSVVPVAKSAFDHH